jgi:curved DNA-binding protein CbpA
MKNGMGIEIMEKDAAFTDFVRFVVDEKETNTSETNNMNETQIISFSSCEVNNKDARNTMQERRQHKRLKVDHLKVISEMPSASEVKIIDISMSGVLVKADRRLNIANKYALRIGYRESVLFVKAVVMWSLLVESVDDANGNIKPVYLAGMQFTNVSNEKIEEILSFIEGDTQSDIQLSVNHNNFSEESSIEEDGRIPQDMAPEEVQNEIETESSGEITEKIVDMYNRCKNEILNYYEILDVKDFANADQIKKAYYKRAKELHPDRHSHLPHETKEKLSSIFAHLTEAYEILMNSESKKKYDKSLTFKTATVSNEELAHREFEQGKIEFWNANLSEATVFFQKAIYFNNSSAKYFYFYAKTLLKLGKIHEAEKAIKKALNLDPLNPDYSVEAGCIYHALGLSYRARENFETALRIEPSNAKAHEGMMGLKGKKEGGGFRDNVYNPIKAFTKIIVK